MISTRPFGLNSTLYTLKNGNGMEADITDFGATVVAIRVPSKNGTLDVVLGYDDAQGYLAGDNYLGATVSRYGNRLAHSAFSIDGVSYCVQSNEEDTCLHGGSDYHLKLWQTTVENDALTLSYTSPEGDFGFPGELQMQVTFSLDDENGLRIDYSAKSNKKTLCNMTNHTYFNLNGNRDTVLKHRLCIHADTYTQVDAKLIPTADAPVAGTEFDFRTPRAMEKPIYDHNFNLRGGNDAQVTLYCPESGVFMEVFTDRPAVQIYNSVALPEQADKKGTTHGIGSGIAIETQVPPNAPNRAECDHLRPDYLTVPQQTWHSTTVYRFSLR